MSNDSAFSKSVIASVVASVLVIIFINPLLNVAWRFLSWFGTHVYEGLNNAIYSNAALGQRDWVAVLILNLNMGIVIGILTPFLLMFIFGTIRIHKIGSATSSMRAISKISTAILYLVLVSAILILLSAVRADLQLNTSFQQRSTVLAPVASDLEVKQLKASWALMKTRRDYETIMTKMEIIAKKHGLVLPTPLLK